MFMGLFTTTMILVFLVMSGWFAGQRAKWFAIALGAFTIFDLGRAALPFVVHWDYRQKYDLDLKNPVIEFLRDRPYEHRVAAPGVTALLIGLLAVTRPKSGEEGAAKQN